MWRSRSYILHTRDLAVKSAWLEASVAWEFEYKASRKVWERRLGNVLFAIGFAPSIAPQTSPINKTIRDPAVDQKSIKWFASSIDKIEKRQLDNNIARTSTN